MESFEDSNCLSMTDSLSVYERYLRSFNVVNHCLEEDNVQAVENCEYEGLGDDNVNIDLSVNQNRELDQNHGNLVSSYTGNLEKHLPVGLDIDVRIKTEDSNCPSPALYTENTENSLVTADHSLSEKSNLTDIPAVSSEESKSECFKQPIFITSNMENSNNAVDSVPLFRNIKPSESVFKLPIRELSFNGTLKHVQKLKPIVDPITALTSNVGLVLEEKSDELNLGASDKSEEVNSVFQTSSIVVENELDVKSTSSEKETSSSCDANKVDKVHESTSDSQYDENIHKNDDSSSRWNEQSYSSLEASFDSGVRSPDMFSDEEDVDPAPAPASESFWSFIKDYETFDKKRVRKLEETLQGVLPPPSITTFKLDATEMLKKYYCYLPIFNEEKISPKKSSVTPTKRVSFVQSPTDSSESVKDALDISVKIKKSEGSSSRENMKTGLDTSWDKSIELKNGTEEEAKESEWPEVLKCRYHDVYYNTNQYSEKFELLALRCGERFIGAETDCTVSVYSTCLQSPSSATKRKAMRLKLAQAKSPGRRLSHLARRRQAFCSAATINEKAHSSGSKMVLIDRKKLINSGERKSPRLKRTPGKKTPSRKTPGKKTPGKTPRSGSSTKKRAMRRLLMDSDNVTKSQPRENMFKRALFISPENRKHPPQASTTSVPVQPIKSRRSLFGSPALAETKSMDGTVSDQFLKRKRDFLDEPEMQRSKIAKSLSFGGDNIGGSSSFGGNSSSVAISRRASEVFADRNPFELNETHKKKLLWAVSEALRVHGWRMSSPGFREKASSLARLTRKLLTLRPHAARFTAPTLSTSDTMLRLARQYVFAIIQGRTVEECFQEEQVRLSNEANSKLTGYISATAYQQLKAKPTTTSLTSQIKENCNEGVMKQEQPRSTSKNILQDKLVNIDSNSNSGSNSGLSVFDKSGLFKSNSMPSFEEAAKLRARRQISFDNVDFPKR